MITLHRHSPEGFPTEDRIALPTDEILQIHEGNGGITIVTTKLGKIPVQEDFEEVVQMVSRYASR